MDNLEWQYFNYLNHKLDLIIAMLGTDSEHLQALACDLESKRQELQKSLNQSGLHNRSITMATPTGVSSIDNLISTVAALDSVIDSAAATINGIQGQIQAAVTAALANGATAAQLAPLTDLNTDLAAKKDALAAAVAANTH